MPEYGDDSIPDDDNEDEDEDLTMFHPLNERLEAIESDIRATKDLVANLTNQINNIYSQNVNTNTRILEQERYSANLYVQLFLLWSMWILLPQQYDLTKAKDVTACIQFVRENGAAALGEIGLSPTPQLVAAAWYTKCAEYFRVNGGFQIFPQ